MLESQESLSTFCRETVSDIFRCVVTPPTHTHPHSHPSSHTREMFSPTWYSKHCLHREKEHSPLASLLPRRFGSVSESLGQSLELTTQRAVNNAAGDFRTIVSGPTGMDLKDGLKNLQLPLAQLEKWESGGWRSSGHEDSRYSFMTEISRAVTTTLQGAHPHQRMPSVDQTAFQRWMTAYIEYPGKRTLNERFQRVNEEFIPSTLVDEVGATPIAFVNAVAAQRNVNQLLYMKRTFPRVFQRALRNWITDHRDIIVADSGGNFPLIFQGSRKVLLSYNEAYLLCLKSFASDNGVDVVEDATLESVVDSLLVHKQNVQRSSLSWEPWWR